MGDKEIKIEARDTLVKKYWVGILFLTVILVIAGISIDVWYSDGVIVPENIRLLDSNGTSYLHQNYSFEYEYPILNSLSTFLYSLAMSLMIAIMILRFIQKDEDEERETRHKEQQTEMFNSVFKGVFDRLIPNEIFDVIKSDILEAKVVRKNVKWLYDFKIEEDKLVLYRNVMYEAHNLSSTECIEPFSYVFSSTPYTETKISFLKWHEYGDIKNTEVAYDERHTKLSEEAHKLKHNKKAGDFEQVKKDIKIPVDKAININFKSIEIFKNNINFIHETHFSTACSIGWELEVNFPLGYSFGIIPMFVNELDPIIDDEDRKKYKYDGAILKGQGIEFTLTKL